MGTPVARSGNKYKTVYTFAARRFAIHCVQEDPEKLQLSSLLLSRDPQYAGLKSRLKKKNETRMLLRVLRISSCKIYILWVICTNVFYAPSWSTPFRRRRKRILALEFLCSGSFGIYIFSSGRNLES